MEENGDNQRGHGWLSLLYPVRLRPLVERNLVEPGPENTGMTFLPPNLTVSLSKYFVESGRFSRGNLAAEGRRPSSTCVHLFEIPASGSADAAFLDRLHACLPGWAQTHPPAVRPGFGLSSGSFSDIPPACGRHRQGVTGRYPFRDHMTRRDQTAVEVRPSRRPPAEPETGQIVVTPAGGKPVASSGRTRRALSTGELSLPVSDVPPPALPEDTPAGLAAEGVGVGKRSPEKAFAAL